MRLFVWGIFLPKYALCVTVPSTVVRFTYFTFYILHHGEYFYIFPVYSLLRGEYIVDILYMRLTLLLLTLDFFELHEFIYDPY